MPKHNNRKSLIAHHEISKWLSCFLSLFFLFYGRERTNNTERRLAEETLNRPTVISSKMETEEVTIKCGHFEKRVVLTPAQRDILNLEDKMVCVSGPPGTGKSLVVMLRGRQWLQTGKDVIVLSSHFKALPTSRLIYNQLLDVSVSTCLLYTSDAADDC